VTDTLTIARQLVARGLSVIPVPRPRAGVCSGEPGDGKVPALRWLRYQTERATDAELVEWFTDEPMNLAVVTGAISHVVVVDADSPEALRWATRHLPYTPWQTQTARGFHLWYRCPDVRVANQARVETRDGRLALDVRADGGFVIVAPSVHASGYVYREAGDWSAPRSDVPVFWPGWLERPTPRSSPRARTPVASGDVATRARAYLAAIPRPEIGQGSDAATLYAACRLVRGFGLPAHEAEALLWEWLGGRAGWTRDWVARKVQHAERYGTEPIGALR
jgi:Bifunctional DNA primase/polymerase, N-terminal